MFVDVSLTRDGSRVGIVLKSLEGTFMEQAIIFGFSASNNELKYEALIVGLKKAKLIGAHHLIINCDPQLVANQLTGGYAVRNKRMEAYMRLAQKLFREFPSAYIEIFPWHQ